MTAGNARQAEIYPIFQRNIRIIIFF